MSEPVGAARALDDKRIIERFVRRAPLLHIYELGDLDPFFWPRTQWYGLIGATNELDALWLLYSGNSPPTLLCFCTDGELSGARRLLSLTLSQDRLPPRMYAHLSVGLAEVLEPRYQLVHRGRFVKMGLVDPAAARRAAARSAHTVVSLRETDLQQLEALYARAYPDNWFDARMLQTGHYYGVRAGERLVAAAGVHVYSPQYGAAALGNITTDPAERRRGLGRAVTAVLCDALLDSIEVIGLNIRADNTAAVRLYRDLGFETVAEYDELELRLR